MLCGWYSDLWFNVGIGHGQKREWEVGQKNLYDVDTLIAKSKCSINLTFKSIPKKSFLYLFYVIKHIYLATSKIMSNFVDK